MLYTIKSPLKIEVSHHLCMEKGNTEKYGNHVVGEFVSKEITLDLLEALKELMININTNVNLTNDSILHIGHRFDTLKKANKAIVNAEK